MKDQQVELLKTVARKAGELIRSGSCARLEITEKSSNRDLVTQYDYKVQQLIMDQFLAVYPACAFVSEEGDERGDLYADRLFVIDPIDGTANFVHGLGHSAVSIAYFQRGIPTAGVVYNPYTEELFWAESGAGAFLNSQPIHVSRKPLAQSLVAFGTAPYNEETTEDTFTRAKNLYGKCQDIRRLGAASLDICYVAAGRFGLYFEAALSLWDYAAAGIILREAGGTLVNFDGRDIPLSIEKSSVIAGASELISQSGLLSR